MHKNLQKTQKKVHQQTCVLQIEIISHILNILNHVHIGTSSELITPIYQ